MLSRARRTTETEVVPYDWCAGAVARQECPSPTGRVSEEPREAFDERHQGRLAEVEREAFGKGYAQGERSGAEVAAKRGEAMLRRLTQTIEELAALRSDIIHRTERQVVQLALAIAHRVIDREVTIDRGLLVAMARVALDRLGEHASATIRLHPEDYSAVMAAQESGRTSDQVQIVADPIVGRGGCLVQSDFGLMDVTLDSQFAELARTLLGERDTDPALEHASAPLPLAVRR
jgi:flagellar assembly protein FliH